MWPRAQSRNIKASDASAVRDTIGDLRFRALLSTDEWNALPRPIRNRFSKRVADGNSVVYVGRVVETRLNRAGTFFAHAARLFGGPLPTKSECGVPAVVTVTEDPATGGQIWTRLYASKSGFPQVIHSSKRFVGATGLEEYVGSGLGMALTVHVQNKALLFRSAFYFLRIGNLQITLPAWLTPGLLTVTHAEEMGGQFSFLLQVVHPQFGIVIHQLAIFREVYT